MRLLDRATSRLPRPWRIVLDWLVTIALAVAVVLVFQAEIAKPYRIPTSSMEPTLHCAKPAEGCLAHFSDRVIACEICYRLSSPHRGQIVVFHAPPAASECDGEAPGTFVKRLIGLPGDTVHEDQNAQISIDGRKLFEPYVNKASLVTDTFRDRTWQVPRGDYFMMGDNRGGSCDSRTWGPVPRSDLIGPVVFTYWPPLRISFDA